jgi:hypothetical protein
MTDRSETKEFTAYLLDIKEQNLKQKKSRLTAALHDSGNICRVDTA